MDYFCYISRTKVDQLYETAAPDAVDEWIERKTRDRRVDAKASAGLSLAGIAKLFGGEVGYGSGSGVEIEKKVQVKYVEKLRVVLTAIAAEHGDIPSLADRLAKGDIPLYVHHLGEFRLTEPVRDPRSDQVVTLSSSIDGVSLLLDCSLRFFSSTNEAGELIVHSSNHQFFAHQIPLTLETVFIFLHQEGSEVFGSPLFLILRLPIDSMAAIRDLGV
jgi:hypothetical protein